jgi:hypothetical protein
MASDCIPASPISYELPKNTKNYACQICRAPREICERCQTAGPEIATHTYVKPYFVNPYSVLQDSGMKAQDYACQICRASEEVCEHCALGRRLAGDSGAASVAARRIRQRLVLAES